MAVAGAAIAAVGFGALYLYFTQYRNNPPPMGAPAMPGSTATQNVGLNPPPGVEGQQWAPSDGPSAYQFIPSGVSPQARQMSPPAYGGSVGPGAQGVLQSVGPYVRPPSPRMLPTLPELKQIGLPGHGAWPAQFGISVVPRQYGPQGPYTGSGALPPRSMMQSYGAGGGSSRRYMYDHTYAAPAVPDYASVSPFGPFTSPNTFGTNFTGQRAFSIMDNVTMTGPGPLIRQGGAGGGGIGVAYPVYSVMDNVTMTGPGPRMRQGGAGGGGIALPCIGNAPVMSTMDNVTQSCCGPRIRQGGAGGGGIAYPAMEAPARGGTIRSDRYPTGDSGEDYGFSYFKRRVNMV
jgi:hypothetical protein